MNFIPLSQFNPRVFPEFDLELTFQCADIQSLESDLEASRRERNLCYLQTGKSSRPEWGPVVVGEATAVTDHIDVTQYYRLVSETNEG